MPAYSKDREYEFITRIRAVLVQKHDASGREIKEALETGDDPVALDLGYIYKLVRKIKKERAFRLDLQTLSEVLSLYQDESSIAKTMLWSFINDGGVEVSDKINALRQLHDISTTVLDKLFDAGVFERNLGKLKAEGVLTPEQQAEINQALEYVFRYRKDTGDEMPTGTEAGNTTAAGPDNGSGGNEPDTTQSAGS